MCVVERGGEDDLLFGAPLAVRLRANLAASLPKTPQTDNQAQTLTAPVCPMRVRMVYRYSSSYSEKGLRIPLFFPGPLSRVEQVPSGSNCSHQPDYSEKPLGTLMR